jgi:hypothetical protein
MLDAAARMQRWCVASPLMGWYTALAVAGALSFDDGFRLVQTMSILQKESQESHGGGQILYPLVDDHWADGASVSRVRLADAASGAAFRSIDPATPCSQAPRTVLAASKSCRR